MIAKIFASHWDNPVLMIVTDEITVIVNRYEEDRDKIKSIRVEENNLGWYIFHNLFDDTYYAVTDHPSNFQENGVLLRRDGSGMGLNLGEDQRRMILDTLSKLDSLYDQVDPERSVSKLYLEKTRKVVERFSTGMVEKPAHQDLSQIGMAADQLFRAIRLGVDNR